MKPLTKMFFLFFVAIVALAGCHELGHMDGPGDYGGGFGGNDLVGEVRNVDTRAREIEIRTDNGRREYVRYDDGTRVVYRKQQYGVADLEPGDYVALRARQDRSGGYFAGTITVRESVQDRGGYSGGSSARRDRLDGTVEHIDSRRGTFEVRSRNGRRI